MDVERVEVELEPLVQEEAAPRSGRALKLVAGVLGAVGLIAGGAAALRGSSGVLDVKHVVGMEERVTIVPSFAACSAAKENCFDTGCCQVSGHKCYTTSPGKALCKKKCTQSSTEKCEQPPSASFSVPRAGEAGSSLYCFSLYTKDTGSAKPSYELELLTKQKEFGVSIFGCEFSDVFSDVAVNIGSQPAIQVFDTHREWHQLKRKNTGTWVNWGIFYSIWEQIKLREGAWTAFWTVKADADAVFIPQRLRQYIVDNKLVDTPHGIYLENCKNVQYGYFGNLEVISKTGVKALMDNLEECHQSFAACANDGCDWKYGAWGEDVFVQRCMDHHYVDKVEAFDLTKDGACEADRPEDEKKNKKWKSPDCSAETAVSIHPFKKPPEYFKCMGEIMKTTYNV